MTRRTLKALLCLALIAMMVPGAALGAGKPPSGGTTGTIAAKVTNAATGASIAGAKVTVVGAAGTFTGTTGTKGTVSIAVPAGTYQVTASATGFANKTLSASVTSGRTVSLAFALVKATATTGAISGLVTNTSGIAVTGAAVRTDTGGYSAVTGADGRYSMSAIVPGTYSVTASKDGFTPATKSVAVTAGSTSTADFTLATAGAAIVSVSAAPTSVVEGAVSTITLSATLSGAPGSYEWRQVSGPKVTLVPESATTAYALVGALNVAAETELVFELAVDGTTKQVGVPVSPSDMYPFLGDHVQIGGSAAAVASFVTSAGVQYALYNIGTALKATPVGATKGAVHTVTLPGVISDVDVVSYAGITYALACTGGSGIAVVDLTDPAAMRLLSCTPVNYILENVTFAETGGSILTGNTFGSSAAPIVSLATDGLDVFIADAKYGIHKTALTNLVGLAGPVLEADGTLFIQQEVPTVQYAGERPWGGPVSLTLFGGKVFAALSELGMGIYDPATLGRIGRYNLYTDEARVEDYFGDMAVTASVASSGGDLFLDDDSGMPDYRQVNYELDVVMEGGQATQTAPTPWADFERIGRYYYQTRAVDVVQQGARTIAYMAYSLGGVVAADITGFDSATPGSPRTGTFLGYFPAVPANGPYTTGSNPASLLPYEGAGMLKESGYVDVHASGAYVYATDHFAGLVVLSNAASPETWRGPNAPYDNDTDGIPGNDVPEHEECTSFDMSPYDPLDNESLPTAFFEFPCALATGELNGHGNRFMLNGTPDFGTGNVDVMGCSGAGGFVFVDLKKLTARVVADRFAILAYFPSTDEVGAYPDGSAGQTMAIGHSSGIDASTKYLYLSDGPHGVSAWNLLDSSGFQSDVIHVVGNTLQDEYPQVVNGVTIYPPSHTVRNIVDTARGVTWALCVRNGLRRVPIAGIEAGLGAVGSPLLMKLARTDLFEHNSDFNVPALNFQDLSYDAEFRGDWAYVADGSNGITIYDVSKDPSNATSGFYVGNLGSDKKQPMFGTASGIETWTDPATSKVYAVLSCGPYGVGVAEVTDLATMRIVKVFEPIKYEDGDVGSADGQAIDVEVIGDKAYFCYDSFGVVCYSMTDLIAPLPVGVSPTELFKKSADGVPLYDYRPVALGRFKLQLVPGYETVDGGANRLDHTQQAGRLYLYTAFAEAGLVKIDFTDPANPTLVQRVDTAAECGDVVVRDGRVYCADGSGGMVFFK